MIVLFGCVVVFGAVLAGFVLAGGEIGALIHPTEFLTIGGAVNWRHDRDVAEKSAN